ncbi:SURF1 family protein [Propionibacteriaceae bacterium Y1923]
MTRLKQAGIMALGLVVAVLMVVLGLWQANTARTHGQAATQERAAMPAVALPDGASGDAVTELYGRQVSVTGEYLPELQYYVGDKPPLRIVTAFRTQSGQVVPIVRGQVGDGQTPADAPIGLVQQTGLLLPSEKDFHGQLGDDLPEPVIPTVKLERLAQEWPTPLLNGFISLSEADSQAQSMQVATVVLPEGEGSERNAGYALQWWVFAAFALVMCGVWARQLGRNAKRQAARAAALKARSQSES